MIKTDKEMDEILKEINKYLGELQLKGYLFGREEIAPLQNARMSKDYNAMRYFRDRLKEKLKSFN